MTTYRYFTFGPDQVHPEHGITEPRYQYVRVGINQKGGGLTHRLVFMNWLGDNEFSSEYDEDGFMSYYTRHHPSMAADIVVTVSVVT